jgi:hypothetical protein
MCVRFGNGGKKTMPDLTLEQLVESFHSESKGQLANAPGLDDLRLRIVRAGQLAYAKFRAEYRD